MNGQNGQVAGSSNIKFRNFGLFSSVATVANERGRGQSVWQGRGDRKGRPGLENTSSEGLRCG